MRGVLPALVLIVLLAGAVWLWRLQVRVERHEALYERSTLVAEWAERAERAIGAEVKSAASLAKVAMGTKGETEFRAAVESTIGPTSVSPQRAVAWVGPNWVVEYLRSDGADPLLAQGRDLCKYPGWEDALRRSRDERQPRVVEAAVRDGRGELLVVVPAISGEGTAAPYLGAVATRLEVGRALASIVRDASRKQFDFEFSDGATVLVRHGRAIDEGATASEARPVRVADHYLRLRLRPIDAEAARDAGRAALWVLWVGMGFAILLSWAVGHALRRRWEAVVQAERQVEAMRSMAQTAGVISAIPGAGTQALERLATSAKDLLRADLVTVLVLDAATRRVEVVARAGEGDPNPRDSYSLDEARATRDCLRTGEVVVVEDVESDERVNRPVMRGHDVRSAMFVPLVVEREVIGAMFMGYGHPRTFAEAEKQLARMLGSQAGVALANARLHEQKDAALASQKELTRRHEKLYQIATEIFRSADLEASLQRLADAAPAVLGVDLCVVSLRVGADETRIVAVTNNFANCRGERNRASTSNLGRVWTQRRPLIIEDGPNDPTLHPAYRHRLHVGSVIYLPLLGTERGPIGTMTLIRHKVGPFRPEQVELAEALAARASEAIETARLHEESRRAAQTHQMLLRELNHRVKNNLASIVALLAMDRPPMPPDAAAWVTRVSERIATMARTHELFVGGNDRVGLHELVNKLLPALSLIRPSGVEIRSDLDGVEVELGTERAVSLAMVLNELCWNALEHGMGENGVLQIRGYGTPGNRLVIEVEDDGRGDGAGMRAAGETAAAVTSDGRGTGLRLVQGLVSRELRGRFAMERLATGGTRARIDIPLEEGEAGPVSL